MACRFLSLAVLGLCGVWGCGDFSPALDSAPSFGGPAPSQPPPTGEKWQETPAVDSCGRTTLVYELVDEMCAGTDAPGYLASLRSPMFRDGARIGDHLFVVDGTHLWTMKLGDRSIVARMELVSGLGQPLAIKAHGQELLVAAAGEGLRIVDASEPLALRLKQTLEFPGPVLDVHLDGDTAFVALGAAGVGVVDLTPQGAGLRKILPVGEAPLFAAAVAGRGPYAYVAACSGLLVVDIESGETVGKTWVSKAFQGERLVAPAKDVELVGEVAFVAAGRFGAVAVDVADPTQPAVLGNCTEPFNPTFYASGVRAEGTSLYVAGGEWGVHLHQVADPRETCSLTRIPSELTATKPKQTSCNAEPPWKQVPWVEVYGPPPLQKDPIQVLPSGDVVFAFGDASRIGVRAVDVRDAKSLDLVDRYDEPRVAMDIAVRDGKVLVVGSGGGFFRTDPGELLVRTGALPEKYKAATAGRLLDDGTWALLAGGTAYLEGGGSLSAGDDVSGASFAARGSRVALASQKKVHWFDAATGQRDERDDWKGTAETPPALAFSADGLVLAAPEWTRAVALPFSRTPGPQEPHGVFSAEQIEDANAWRRGLPRRLLIPTDAGVLEVASLGGEAGAKVLQPGSKLLALPPATYVAGASSLGRSYLVGAERASYTSLLVVLEHDGGSLRLVASRAFTGQATGVAVEGDRVYVSDADIGVHVYGLEKASLAPLGVVSLEGSL